MRDGEKYKYAYSGSWSKAVRREQLVANILEQLGYSPELDGFGAGGEEFIEGLAVDNGKETAAPDIYLTNEDVFIEVTGTDNGSVSTDDTVWVRPDKFEYAKRHPEQDVWVVHILDGPALPRAIHLTDDVIKTFVDTGEDTDTHHVDDETYVKIPPDHDYINQFTALLSALDADETHDQWWGTIGRAFYRWETIGDIEENSGQFSLALHVDNIDTVDSDKSNVPESFITVTDRNGDSVEIVVWPDTEFGYAELETDQWYFFADLSANIHNGQEQFIANDTTEAATIYPEFNR